MILVWNTDKTKGDNCRSYMVPAIASFLCLKDIR